MITWTPAHTLEAMRFGLETTARRFSLAEETHPAALLQAMPTWMDCQAERPYRHQLKYGLLMSEAEIDAALVRLDKLARGELVREDGWYGLSPQGVRAWTTEEPTAAAWRLSGSTVKRVRRVRTPR